MLIKVQLSDWSSHLNDESLSPGDGFHDLGDRS